MSCRRGYSLIELLLVMWAGMVLLGLSVFLLQVLLRIDGAARDQAAQLRARSRLLVQLRDDVHQAVGITDLDSARPAIELELPNAGRVEYGAIPGGIRRTESTAGKTQERDEFVVGKGTEVRFEVIEEHGARLVRTTLKRSDERVRPGLLLVSDARLSADLDAGRRKNNGR